MATLQVSRIEPATRAEGPGLRWAIWVQGCSIGCAGCCNPHTWATGGDKGLDIDDLARQLIDVPVEGVTFLGGEPFDQAPGLAELGSVAQESGLSVMTFTGYRYETLRDGGGAGWQQLLTVTDLLVDGPYVRHRPDTVRPWVGSTNQRFIHLTDRYLDHPFEAEEDRMEIRIRPDGTVAINGWPEAGLLVGLEDLVAEDW